MLIFFQEFRLKHYAGDVTYCVNGNPIIWLSLRKAFVECCNLFLLWHILYTGDINLNIFHAGFMDKNNDLLFRDLKEVSVNEVHVSLFLLHAVVDILWSSAGYTLCFTCK